MAIVQISKIQHRRGRKLSNTGMPQLASGEIGWAIDTQQLYIGNGAVSEGAPYVGNTEILTEKTNIFELVNTYEYKNNDPYITVVTGPLDAPHVKRSLQERLDDTVSINAFISPEERNNGDLTDAIQRAVDQLYLNDSRVPATRVILEFEAGEYTISNSIKVPPYVNLRGAGKEKTVIIQTGNFPIFETVAGTSIPGNYVVDNASLTSDNQPQSIQIDGFTLKHTVTGYPVAVFRSVRNSYFSNIRFQGAGHAGGALTTNEAALQMTAKSSMVSCSQNIFENCDFTDISYGIDSTYDIDMNIFENCFFLNLGLGVLFGAAVDNTSGKTYGPRNNKFSGCRFTNIDRQGVLITKGRGNLLIGNRYFRVGNNGGSSTAAVYPVVSFGEASNVSTNESFERSVELTSDPTMIINTPYVGEYGGQVNGDHKYNGSLGIVQVGTPTVLFRLSAYDNARYRVNYIYKSQVANIVRNGVLYVTVDRINNSVQLSEEYDFSGDEARAENLKITATLEDLNADGVFETIFIRYSNSTGADQGSFNYWYDVLS